MHSRIVIGGTYYLADPYEVRKVHVVEFGDGGRNFKRGFRHRDPVVVREQVRGPDGRMYADEMVVSARSLFSSAMAAAAKAAAEEQF